MAIDHREMGGAGVPKESIVSPESARVGTIIASVAIAEQVLLPIIEG